MSRKWLYGGTLVFCVAVLLGSALRFLWFLNDKPAAKILADPESAVFCRQIDAEFQQRRFDDLEKTEHSLVSLKARFVGGREKLTVFYDSIAALGCDPVRFCKTEPNRTDRIRLAQDWLNRKPHDLVAKIAMAAAWYRYAWSARQCEAFGAITFDQWQSFFDRVRVARSYLRGFDPNADPEFYLLMINIQRDSSGSRAAIDATYEQGHDNFPTFMSLVAAYTVVLDPNWYGKKGEVDWLAEATLNDSGREIGQATYSVIAQTAISQASNQKLLSVTGLDWAKIKQGYFAREKLFGLTIQDWNAYGYIAMAASDRAAAQEAYRHFGGDWDPDIWGSSQFFFGQALPWIKADS